MPMSLRADRVRKGQRFIIFIEDPFDSSDNVARNISMVMHRCR